MTEGSVISVETSSKRATKPFSFSNKVEVSAIDLLVVTDSRRLFIDLCEIGLEGGTVFEFPLCIPIATTT